MLSRSSHDLKRHPPANLRLPSRRPAHEQLLKASGLLLTENSRLIPRPKSLLQSLSEGEQAKVRALGRSKHIAMGAEVFTQGSRHDGIYLIETGQVRVFYTAPMGRQITLAYWNAGNFVGGPQVFGTSVHAWSGVATTDCTVFLLPGAALRALAMEIPALAVGIIEGLAFKGECYSALAQMLGTRSVSERLIHLLTRLAEIYGVREGASLRIDADFNHADLANIVGATRQWVTAMLKRLQEKNVLEMDQGQIVLIDQKALLEMERSAS